MTSGQSISYATVSLLRNAVKTMSNEEGNFIFKVHSVDESDTIYVSHVGYSPHPLSFIRQIQVLES